MRQQRVVSGYNSKLKAGSSNGEKCRGEGEIKIISLSFLRVGKDFLFC